MTLARRANGLVALGFALLQLGLAPAVYAENWSDDEPSVMAHRSGNSRVYTYDDDVEPAGFGHHDRRSQSWCDTDCSDCEACQSNGNSCEPCRGHASACDQNCCDSPFEWLSDLFCDHGHKHHDCCFEDSNWRKPIFTVEAGTIIMTRSVPHPTGLAVDSQTGQSLLDAKDLRYTWEAGPDISIMHSCGCGNSIQGRYFEIDQIHARTSFTPPSGAFDIPMMVPLTGLPTAGVDVGYASRLKSGEFNAGHCDGGRIVWLAGFRWLEFREDLNYAFDTAGVDFNTTNRLYGGQLGMNLRLHDTGGHLFFDGIMKAGIYGNVAANGFTVGDNTGLLEAANDRRTQVAFVGEVGLQGAYQWTHHIATRCGYQVMWLEGVAVASDQVGAITQNGFEGTGINTLGGLFYHGATASIDVSW